MDLMFFITFIQGC